MLGALLCLCGIDCRARAVGRAQRLQITFIRSAFCLAALLLLLRVIGFSRVLKPEEDACRPQCHSFRRPDRVALWHRILPLAEVFAIEFTAPIWTAILATVILGERLSRYRMLAIVLGFAGIVVILRPGIAAIQPAALVVLFAAVCFASTYVFTRHMSTSETPLTVILHEPGSASHGPGHVTAGWTLPSLMDLASRCHGARLAFLFRPCIPPRRRHGGHWTSSACQSRLSACCSTVKAGMF